MADVMVWKKARRDPTADLERVTTRLLGEIAEAAAALKAAAASTQAAAEHLSDVADELIKLNEGEKPDA